jgi:uncharacterized protein (DUF1800 family)
MEAAFMKHQHFVRNIWQVVILFVMVLVAPSSMAAGTQIEARDAFRFLQQATFGPNEATLKELSETSIRAWLKSQMNLSVSKYSGRERDQSSKWDPKFAYDYCGSLTLGSAERDRCGDQFISSHPIRRDFFKNASQQPDQLRQRLAYALAQILVISDVDLPNIPTYGLADFYQMIHDNSLGTYGELLRSVSLHPIMGRYLNLVNNDKAAPNENFARELLQLFSLGTCELLQNGRQKGSECIPVFNSLVVREYAYALSGYTYPKGGTLPGGSTSAYDLNASYFKGAMEPSQKYRDTSRRSLLSGVVISENSTAPAAMSAVIQSIEAHPNLAPFISRQLIQQLVTSNPSPEYVVRVSQVFDRGIFEDFGAGKKGDLKAVVAAILLDEEAREDRSSRQSSFGKLREPILKMIAAVRALNGFTDGEEMGDTWQSAGLAVGQPFLNSPTVFNFFRPENSLPGTTVLSPEFQLISPNSVLGWINLVDDLVYGWDTSGTGLRPKINIPDAIGTRLRFLAFEDDAFNADKLVSRLSGVLLGGDLNANEKKMILQAVNQISSNSALIPDWKQRRAKMATYLMLSLPQYQVQK